MKKACFIACTGLALLGQQPQFNFKSTTEIVLVDVAVRDAKGGLVRDLTPDDFTVSEDGKSQKIVSFEFDDIDRGMATATAAGAATGPEGIRTAGSGIPVAAPKPAAPAEDAGFKDRRLMVFYFDLTTMQPEDVANAEESAEAFVNKEMKPADLVAIATLGNSFQLNQEFTADKEALLHKLRALDPTAGESLASGTDDGSTQTGNAYIADSSEFNIVNADRSLVTVQALCNGMARIQQKKAMVLYSSGIQRSGTDNEITLRSAVNACVKADVAIYTMDARGLDATPPGGGAASASAGGAGAYNGQAQAQAFATLTAQQETISTLASDTGGRPFFDSNEFGPVYAQVEKDTEAYYLISYTSNNPVKDGKYRKIEVKLKRPGLKLTARPGYYANKDLPHMNTADRDQQLRDELDSTVTDNSLDLYLTQGYFRLDKDRYYVPVSLAIPGAEIPLHGLDPKATPQVDLLGEVLTADGRPVQHVQETIPLDKLQLGGAKNLQYDTGFLLEPGQKYQVRFAARENQTGQMGAYSSAITVPDLEANAKTVGALSISSVVIGNQLAPVKPNSDNPMSASGNAVVPSISHVFSANQHLYVYFEIYDAKLDAQGAAALLTDVAFFQGRAPAFESAPIKISTLRDAKRKAAIAELDIPLGQLKPGYYTCQVNALDQASGRVAFPRFPILVKAEP